ncbi:hypothetical protein ACR52_15235 [Pseudomonas fildesensis]|uniref:Uncharacterized protein n=1 Tax=Pseudomonas fildesensis TaxID=1674920 RepID=A0A0J8G2A7_9PSED|nr:hypothetical protein ACR52_15235 [Pseudomonas fildesensis]
MDEFVITHRKFLLELRGLLVVLPLLRSTILRLAPLDSGWKAMIIQGVSYGFTLKALMGSQLVHNIILLQVQN